MGCCGEGPAPTLRSLWQELQAEYGSRVKYYGICGDAVHCARKSDHNEGNALDIGVDSPALGVEIRERLEADRRCTYTIFRASVHRAYHRGHRISGGSGHWTHVHLSIYASARNNLTPWLHGGDDVMNSTQEAKLDRALEILTDVSGRVAGMHTIDLPNLKSKIEALEGLDLSDYELKLVKKS